MEEFLTLRSQNAAETNQKEAARQLLKAAQEASKKEWNGERLGVFSAHTLENRFKVLESWKAERLLENANILQGSSDWTRRDYLAQSWPLLNTRNGNIIREALKKEKDSMSEEEKKKCDSRLNECLNFSNQEERIIDGCTELKLHRKKSPHEYERERLKLLKMKEGK